MPYLSNALPHPIVVLHENTSEVYNYIIIMLKPLKYLYCTIEQEIKDQTTIITEIFDYYYEEFKESLKTKRLICDIHQRLARANNYQQWREISLQYDQLDSVQEHIHLPYSPYYDYRYIQELTAKMNSFRKNREYQLLISLMRSHGYRNIGNMNSPLLFRRAYNSSKKLLQDFQQEVALSLQAILNANMPIQKKVEFFSQMRHAVGRSALLLSGGAILGMYHIGVVQALIEADCMPRIIAGSSAGSIIASILATQPRQNWFQGANFSFKAFANKKKHSLWRKFKRIGRQGYLMDIGVLKDFMRDNIGDVTFQQAYDAYGWILNITVTGSSEHDQDRLLNYLTAPNVLIWSASVASCAIPFVYGATDLLCKSPSGELEKYTLMNRKFLDGSISSDLPTNKLSIFFNVNNFIVSQTNPWVIPFMDYSEELRSITNPLLVSLFLLLHRLKQFGLSQVRHRAHQLSYLFPSAIFKFFNIFTQSYVGNITIWPVPSLSDYLRILENPTGFQMIANFIQNGRLRTYPKIHHIKSSLFFQKEIERCLKKAKIASKKQEMAENLEEQEENEQNKDFFDSIKFQMMEDEPLSPTKPMLRNQSFMIPRQKSFDTESPKQLGKRVYFMQKRIKDLK